MLLYTFSNFSLSSPSEAKGNTIIEQEPTEEESVSFLPPLDIQHIHFLENNTFYINLSLTAISYLAFAIELNI